MYYAVTYFAVGVWLYLIDCTWQSDAAPLDYMIYALLDSSLWWIRLIGVMREGWQWPHVDELPD